MFFNLYPSENAPELRYYAASILSEDTAALVKYTLQYLVSKYSLWDKFYLFAQVIFSRLLG